MVRRFVLMVTLLVGLPVGAAAQGAALYQLTWYSQTDAPAVLSQRPVLQCETGQIPDVTCRVGPANGVNWPITTKAAKSTVALLVPIAGGLEITFEIPGARQAVLDVLSDAEGGLSVAGVAPVFLPQEISSGGFQLKQVELGGFDWAGRFQTPDAFILSAGSPPGSSPEITFLGFAIRRPPMTASITNLNGVTAVSGTQSIGMRVGGAAGGSSTFTLAVDGQTIWTQALSADTASFDWNTTAVTNGPHTLTFTARDAAGQTAIDSRTITVSNAPAPFTASISYPAENAVVQGNVRMGLSTTARWGTNKTVTLSVDGTVIMSQTITGTTLWWNWNTALVGNGARMLMLRVTDGQGRTATAVRTVTVRNPNVNPAALRAPGVPPNAVLPGQPAPPPCVIGRPCVSPRPAS